MNHKIEYYLLVVAMMALPLGCAEEQTVASTTKPIANYSRTFNDLNDLHKESAEINGIRPVKAGEDIGKVLKKLKEVETCKNYELADLTHSLPYLVPKADKLLNNIGKEFQRRLKERKLPPYKIRVTSVLRTQENVKNLRRRNGNSSSNSAHIHATTFDISYVKYAKVHPRDKEISTAVLKNVLAEVLLEQRSRKQCYVKYEIKQGCFHITVR